MLRPEDHHHGDELREALTQFVDQVGEGNWSFYATVTFRRPPRDAIAASSAILRQLRRVPALSRPRTVFYGVEAGRRGTPHLHALWGAAQGDASWRWWNRWGYRHFGISRFYPYAEGGGATEYVAKYIVKESAFDGSWGAWTFADLF